MLSPTSPPHWLAHPLWTRLFLASSWALPSGNPHPVDPSDPSGLRRLYRPLSFTLFESAAPTPFAVWELHRRAHPDLCMGLRWTGPTRPHHLGRRPEAWPASGRINVEGREVPPHVLAFYFRTGYPPPPGTKVVHRASCLIWATKDSHLCLYPWCVTLAPTSGAASQGAVDLERLDVARARIEATKPTEAGAITPTDDLYPNPGEPLWGEISSYEEVPERTAAQRREWGRIVQAYVIERPTSRGLADGRYYRGQDGYETFWARVVRTGGHQVWTGAYRGHQPVLYVRGHANSARRLAYLYTTGELPPAGRHVRNRCGDYRCVDPDHSTIRLPRTRRLVREPRLVCKLGHPLPYADAPHCPICRKAARMAKRERAM